MTTAVAILCGACFGFIAGALVVVCFVARDAKREVPKLDGLKWASY